MKLTNVIDPTKQYLFQLLDESDTAMTFTLQDPDTGLVRRVEVLADVDEFNDTGLLFSTVVEQSAGESAREFWARGDESHVYAQRVEVFAEKLVVQGGLF